MCGEDLDAAEPAGIARSHQVHEVPLVTESVVQHDLHRVRCACGRKHVAERLGDVSAAPVSYGPEPARSGGVSADVPPHPVHWCAQLIADLTGARPARPHFATGRSDPAFRTKPQLSAALAARAKEAGFA